MSDTVSAQHPAVVLRSSYQLVKTLLVVAAIAVVGLTVAVVVLAISNGPIASVSPVGLDAAPNAITSAPGVRPNPDQQGQTASPPAITSVPGVRPNPGQQFSLSQQLNGTLPASAQSH